jgi:predicted transcriptional regulator
VKSTHPLTAELARQGIKHAWFARQLGVSTWMLSHYLAGRRAVPDRFYRECALLLRVPVDTVKPEPATEAVA